VKDTGCPRTEPGPRISSRTCWNHRSTPWPIQLDDSRSQFNNEFFTESPNRLLEWLPDAGSMTGTLKVIRVEDYAPRSHLKVVMNDEIGKAVAFLVRD